MKGDFLGVHHLLCVEHEFINVSVLVLAFNQHGVVETGDKVFGFVGALPAVSRSDLLAFVVDVVDRRSEDFSVVEVEGAEHRVRTKVDYVDLEVIVLFVEEELSFSDDLLLRVIDEVIVDYSLAVDRFGFSFVRDADQAEHIGLNFPNVDECAFHFVQIIGFSNRVLNSKSLQFSLRLIPDIKGSKFKLFVMSLLEPDEHRVVVALFGNVLVRPFVILRLINCHSFLRLF